MPLVPRYSAVLISAVLLGFVLAINPGDNLTLP